MTTTDIKWDKKATELVTMAAETKERALVLQVRSPHEFEQVSAFRRDVKGKYQEIERHRVYLKAPHLEGCRRIDEFFKAPLTALKGAEDNAKKVLLGYEAEQRRAAAKEQQKIDAEARRKREAFEAKARDEREKADAKLAEAKLEEEAARKAGDIAAAVKLRHHANVAAQKSEVKAQTADSNASLVNAIEVKPYVPPVVGQHTRTKWKGKVTNIAVVPKEFMIMKVNQKAIDAFAQATKGEGVIPGVEIYSEQTMVGGS